MSGLLALVNRSLTFDCRQVGASVARASSVAVLVIFIAIARAALPNASGLTFAGWLIWLNYTGITMAGFSWFAAAITEERERRTLSLLRMTHVNSASLLLGKLMPRFIAVLLLLAVQFPLTVLTVTMGGVTIQQMAGSLLALMAYAFMMTGIGLLWSAVCTNSRRASWLTVTTWLVLTCGPSVMGMLLPGGRYFVQIRDWLETVFARQTIESGADWLITINSGIAEMSLFRKMFWALAIGQGEAVFDYQVATNVLVGIGSIGLAWFVLEYITTYKLEATVSKPFRLQTLLVPFKWLVPVLTLGMMSAKRRQARRPDRTGRCWQSALAWKEFHFVAGGWRFMLIKALLYPGFVVMIVSLATGTGTPFTSMWYQMGGTLMFGVGMVALSAEITGLSLRMFGTEIKNGTLHELMMLPLSVRQLAYSKIMGGSISLLPAVLMIVTSFLIPAERVTSFGGPPIMFFIVGLAAFTFFIHLTVLLSLYMHMGGVIVSFVVCYFLTAVTAMLLDATGTNDNPTVTLVLTSVAFTISILLHFKIGSSVQRIGQSAKVST